MTRSKIRKKFAHLKPTVVEMRKQGKTYSEIRNIYPISKGTLSLWLQFVKIPAKNKKEMEERSYKKWKKANNIFIKHRIDQAQTKRTATENKAKAQIKKITKRDLLIIGSMLYWAEGSKKSRNYLRFSNSDPEIIQIIMIFFRNVCNIPDAKIKAKVHIYPQMDYQKVLRFWSKITRLPKTNFYKPQTQISKASKKKKINNLPYGTLHIDVTNTEKTCTLKGWIKGISEKTINNNIF